MTTAVTPETTNAEDLRSLKIDAIDDLLGELAEFKKNASSEDSAVFKFLPITITFDLQGDRAVQQLEESLDWLLATVRNARNRVRTMRRQGSFPQ